ncbi:MAG: ABC transporter permease [Acetivibrionales bacterium]|jgi:putative ABC transport system permease protein
MGTKTYIYSIFIRTWFTAKMALQGILANSFRSALTILGVAIGVASVVSLMGIGEGARIAVVEQFKSFGANVISVQAQHPTVEFEAEYIQELLERVEGLKAATPVVHTDAMMKWRRDRFKVEVVGVNSDYPSIRDHQILEGRFFTSLHVKNRSPVALLGYNVAKGMVSRRSVVGHTLALGDQTYTIVGILEPKGEGNADDIDNKIVIPYTLAQKIADKRTVEEIWAKAESREYADLAVVQMSRIIKRKLGLDLKAPTGVGSSGAEDESIDTDAVIMEKEAMAMAAGDIMVSERQQERQLPQTGEDAVTITNLNQLVEEADKANRVMTLLLGGIAAVSLLVGGLGIMNIMMVAVSERTEEIGVRRALGAKQADLLLQFVLEALYVSLIGSVVGIVAGIWGLSIFGNLGFETAVSFKSIRIAVIVAISSGLLFGVYPAVSASSVPPVEALRSQ